MRNKIQEFLLSDFMDKLRSRCFSEDKLSLGVSYSNNSISITISKSIKVVNISQTLEMTENELDWAYESVTEMFDRFYKREQEQKLF